PASRCWFVPATSIKVVVLVVTAPDNHFTARPHRRVKDSGQRRIDNRGRCPTIRAGIVSAAGVQNRRVRNVVSTPDDHLATGPYRPVKLSCIRCIYRGGSSPSVITGA